ncbi:MAG TPA: hypothetical protein VEG60_25325 [Candidatus Binatia bacterium]|nr:hypothetical protein [Candidatus Binatia bacterium]
MKWPGILLLSLALAMLPTPLKSSDHADPIVLEVLESGITDLFAFPDGEQLIVMLNVRRALTAPPPYQLEPFEYAIYMDVHSEVTVDNPEHRARYGGTIKKPGGIKEDVTIKIRLKNDATLNSVKYDGLQNTERIKLVTGVFDDPFIFPRFFKRNTIAMILSIPFSSFPDKDRMDWILWGTSVRLKDAVQIDHVGRSNRSQQGRFDFLNTLHPSRHVVAIKEHNQTRERIEKFLMECFPPLANAFQLLFKIRPYDDFPDVMIYTKRYPVGFPNGRKLTDDVAALTCEQGDCPLVESSYIDSPQWPRATENDKPFSKEFPYLAPAWPPPEPKPAESISVGGTLGALKDLAVFSAELITMICRPLMLLAVVGIVAIAIIIGLLIQWCRSKTV